MVDVQHLLQRLRQGAGTCVGPERRHCYDVHQMAAVTPHLTGVWVRTHPVAHGGGGLLLLLLLLLLLRLRLGSCGSTTSDPPSPNSLKTVTHHNQHSVSKEKYRSKAPFKFQNNTEARI